MQSPRATIVCVCLTLAVAFAFAENDAKRIWNFFETLEPDFQRIVNLFDQIIDQHLGPKPNSVLDEESDASFRDWALGQIEQQKQASGQLDDFWLSDYELISRDLCHNCRERLYCELPEKWHQITLANFVHDLSSRYIEVCQRFLVQPEISDLLARVDASDAYHGFHLHKMYESLCRRIVGWQGKETELYQLIVVMRDH